MNISTETITPKQAEKYLQSNISNRPLRKLLVGQYAKDMMSGKWRLTHQGIAFNCDGTLLDGQHRLRAIIESGTTVRMVVARGVDSQSQLVMDDHAKRSANDALSLIRLEQITKSDIAVIRGAVELSIGRTLKGSRLTKQELNEALDTFRPALDFVNKMVGSNERGVTSAPVKSAIALSWFYVKDLERLGAFCDLVTGRVWAESIGDRSAVTLREWLLKTGMEVAALRLEGFKKTQRAIIAFMDRKDVGRLYGTSVYYPWPLIDPVR